MKKFHLLLAAFAFMLFLASCQQERSVKNNTDTGYVGDSILTIVNWNVEWLGSTQNGPINKELQQQNAVKILRYLHADIYCLCEIVDVQRLKDMVAALGQDYSFVVADYASGASSATAPYYKTAQKQAFVYNNKVFSQVSTKKFLKDNSAAGYNFASGRYPYLLNADVTKNGITQNISFFLIHAKAGADHRSYSRRKKASIAFKAALDAGYKGKNFIVLGDFNDELNGSITQGMSSPYLNFVQDDAYNPISLPLAQNGGHSTLDYPSVIDQQIISKELNRFYLANSAQIRTDVSAVVSDYASGNTSDHYPISSSYVFSDANAMKLAGQTSLRSVNNIPHLKKGNTAKPFSAELLASKIAIRTAAAVNDIQFVLYNQHNKKLVSVHRKYLKESGIFYLHTHSLTKGRYDLVIFSDKGKQVIELEKN